MRGGPLPFLTLGLFLSLSLLLAGVKDCAADRSVPTHQGIVTGIHALYDWRFEEAEGIFRDVIRESPDTPVGHFYLSMVTWSRLASGFWDAGTVNEYHARIRRTVEVGRKRIEENKGNSEDFLYLGGALGFLGRFELMQQNYLQAYFLARNAIDALSTCARMDPQNRDVFLGLGIFDYYTARLSGVLKFLSYLLVHRGDKAEGLRKLHVAASEAAYSATEAKSHLGHIYLFLEEDLAKALVVTRDLAIRYPQNPRYRFLLGVCQLRLGMDGEYQATLDRLFSTGLRHESAEGAAIWRRRAFYLKAAHDLFRGQYQDARVKLEIILERSDPIRDPLMVAWPLIKLGMSYDLEGRREKAVEFYRRILSMDNAAGAQFLAMKYLKVPPTPKDPFLGY